MSPSNRVIRPRPLRTSVGATWEINPPAPMHNTLDLEKTAWSKPAILLCRSSAPGIALPRRLTDSREPVNARRMILDSFPIDFDFAVFVQTHKAHKAVTAENGHDRHVPGAFQPLLEARVRTRWMGRVSAISGVAVAV